MRLVIKDFLKDKMDSRSLLNFRVALLDHQVLKLAFSGVILNNILFTLIKLIFNNHINILSHGNNRNMIILRHVMNLCESLPNCKVGMPLVSNILVVDQGKEKGVKMRALVVHFKSKVKVVLVFFFNADIVVAAFAAFEDHEVFFFQS